MSPWLTVPNIISLVRLGLIPVFLATLLAGRSVWATAIFAFAMISDAVDGLLARVLDQKTKLGGILDPVADKLLVFSALLALCLRGDLPWWLWGGVALRDGMMLLGATVIRWRRIDLPVRPTRIGKYATFALTGTVVLALVNATADSARLAGYVAAVGFVAGVCVVVSTIQYFVRFGYLLFAAPRSSSFVDGERRTKAR